MFFVLYLISSKLLRFLKNSILHFYKYYKRKEAKHMGLKSKKQENLPNDAKPFATIPAFDNKHREPKSGVGIPTEEAVQELKSYMNINKQ